MSKIITNQLNPQNGDTITVNGNLSIGGTLTYEDVTNVDTVGIVTASGVKVLTDGVRIVGGGLTVAGVSTFHNNVELPDGQHLILGDGLDDSGNFKLYNGANEPFEIFGSSKETYIRNAGSNANGINISANGSVTLGGGGTGGFSVHANSDGTAKLYGPGPLEKLRTTTTGVTVTGAITVSDGANLNGYKVEEGDIATTSLNGEFDYNLENGHVQTYTGSTAGNYQPDFKVNGSTTLSSIMDIGDVVTCTLMVASSSHYLASASIKIDDSASNLDIDNVGGSAPSAANGSGYDIYTFTIQKTAATPAYHIVVNTLGAN